MKYLIKFFSKHKVLMLTVFSVGSWGIILATGVLAGPGYAAGLTIGKYILILFVLAIAAIVFAAKKVRKQ